MLDVVANTFGHDSGVIIVGGVALAGAGIAARWLQRSLLRTMDDRTGAVVGPLIAASDVKTAAAIESLRTQQTQEHGEVRQMITALSAKQDERHTDNQARLTAIESKLKETSP